MIVTARNAATNLETTVYTVAAGRDVLPTPCAGHYEIRTRQPRFDNAENLAPLTLPALARREARAQITE